MEKTGRIKEAETCYLKALQLAKSQKAKNTGELSCGQHQAWHAWWEAQGRREEAYLVLSEVYRWFTERGLIQPI